jgi:hypothetical protein
LIVKIQRYTEATVNLLPFWERKSARRELTDTIYNMLQDYCGNEEPTLRDVRDILNELGSPDSMADQFYTQEKEDGFIFRKGTQNIPECPDESAHDRRHGLSHFRNLCSGDGTFQQYDAGRLRRTPRTDGRGDPERGTAGSAVLKFYCQKEGA